LYKALYRKWRPQTFDEIVGQSYVTKTLKNEVYYSKISHAYLFTGSRGTGKTSCAKILAKAINCESPVEGNPCGKCETCQKIQFENLLDIVEIDAASNNGVENIRSIRDEMVFTPNSCKYRVYIVDEVHMLSPGAFNAFLKTLEEPPPHVVFILATTEIHKLPLTIISRCQKFEFHRLSESEICFQLRLISKHEDIKIEESAIKQISVFADGAMRDALSLLDQCNNLCSEVISENFVREMLGIPPKECILEIINGIFAGDFSKVLTYIDNTYKCSGDLVRLCEEIIEYFRNIMIYKATGTSQHFFESSTAYVEKISLNDTLLALSLLQLAYKNMFSGNNKKLELEIVAAKLCYELSKCKAPSNKNLEEISLENTSIASFQEPCQEPENLSDGPLKSWGKILEKIKETSSLKPLYISLTDSQAYKQKNKILINAKSSLAFELLKKPEYRSYVKKIIYEVLGKNCEVEPYNPHVSTEEKIVSSPPLSNTLEDLIKRAKLNNIEIVNKQEDF